MATVRYDAKNPHATDRLGAALARTLPPGSVVALIGTLGAGKTRLVQAVAHACGIAQRDVVSPTFVLVQQLVGERTLCHVDAYRLADGREFDELGVDEQFDGETLVFVEWADRVIDRLPAERIEIAIEVTGTQSRTFVIRDPSGDHAETLAELARMVHGETA